MYFKKILSTILLLITIKSTLSELVLVSNHSNHVAACFTTGNEENSTVAWFEQQLKKPTPSLLQQVTNKSKTEIRHRDWKYENSFSVNYPPVLDEEWEDFQIYKTNKKANKTNNITNNGKPIKHLSISLYTFDSVKINLCMNATECLSLTLNGSFLKYYHNNSPNVKERIFEIIFQQWIHLNMFVNNTDLIIEHRDQTETIELLYNINEVKLESEKDAFWKIHEYGTYITKKSQYCLPLAKFLHIQEKSPICLTMFVAKCKSCKMGITFTFYNSDDILRFELEDTEENISWKKIRAHAVNIPKTMIFLNVWTLSADDEISPFWAIRNIQFCDSESLGIKMSMVKVNNDIKKLSCTLLGKRDSEVSISKYDKNFEYDKYRNYTFGKISSNPQLTCRTIGKYLEDRNCKNLRICKKSECFCAWGYEGYSCNSECEEGYWGIDCNNECIRYCNTGKCNKQDGNCE